MSKDEFSGIVRSSSGHRVSVSQHTGNAKTPKNIVSTDEEDTTAKKLAFEQKKAALIEIKQASIEVLDQHDENFADGAGSTAKKQKLPVDKASQENRQVAWRWCRQ